MRQLLEVFVDRALRQAVHAADSGIDSWPVHLSLLNALEDLHQVGAGGLLLTSIETASAGDYERWRSARRALPHFIVWLGVVRRPALPGHSLPSAVYSACDAVFDLCSASGLERLRIALENRASVPLPSEELRALHTDRGLPNWARRVALHAIRNSHRALSTAQIGAHLMRSVRSLEDDVRDAGLPAVHDLVRCGRMLHRMALARCGVEAPADQADRLGFSDVGAMRKHAWRFQRSAQGSVRLAKFVQRFPVLVRQITRCNELSGS